MFQRSKYIDNNLTAWHTIPDPAVTLKYDGGHYFMQVQSDGSLKYFSRRQSVQGHYPERSEKLPHLSDKKLPQLAGHVYSVELIHTGHDKNNKESHPAVSGILNSLPTKAIETQRQTGPVRAVLLNVINPPLPTYESKLDHLKHVEELFGNPDVLFAPTVAKTKPEIVKLIAKTLREGREGVIATSLSKPEENNPRIKLKHFYTYNLRVVKINQEIDIKGNAKQSAGSLDCVDARGRFVCTVGTGLSKELRKEIWYNPLKWIDQLIQVKAMGLGSVDGKLRSPVYNGLADGDIDII